MTVEEEVKEYKKRFGELNPLYNQCGNCHYADEYGCWQPDCIRKHKTLRYGSEDMQRDRSLPWIPIDKK